MDNRVSDEFFITVGHAGVTLRNHDDVSHFPTDAPLIDSIKLNSSTVAASCVDGTIRLLDLPSKSFMDGIGRHEGRVNRMCVLSDGQFASAGWDDTVRIWGPQGEAPRLGQLKVLDRHSSIVTGVAYYPSKKILCSCSADRTVRTWRLGEKTASPFDDSDSEESGEEDEVKSVDSFDCHANAITSIAVAPSSGLLFTGGLDTIVQIYDLNEEEEESNIGTISGVDREPIYSLKVVEEKSLVVIGTTEGNVCVYDLRNMSGGLPVFPKLNLHRSSLVLHLEQFGTGEMFVSSGMEDCAVKVWSGVNGSIRSEYRYEHPQVGLCSLQEDGEIRGVCPEDGNRSLSLSVITQNESIQVFSWFISEPSTPAIKTREEEEDDNPFAEGLPSSGDEVETIEINDTLDVDQDVFLKLLMGGPVEIPQDHLLDYFALFRHLKLKNRAYVVARQLSRIRDLSIVLAMLETCLRKYEQDAMTEDEIQEGQFQCAFSLAVFNELLNRKREISESEELRARIDEMGIAAKLESHVRTPLHTHANFEFPEDKDLPRTFQDCALLTTTKLWETRKHSNILLRPSTGGSYPTHLEILIFESNYFYRLFRFSHPPVAGEANRGYVFDAHIPASAVESFLEYIYLKKIASDDLGMLLSLHEFSQTYQESKLSRYIASRIKELTRPLLESQDSSFEDFLRQQAPKLRSEGNRRLLDTLKWYWCDFGWPKEKIEEVMASVEDPVTIECPLLGRKF